MMFRGNRGKGLLEFIEHYEIEVEKKATPGHVLIECQKKVIIWYIFNSKGSHQILFLDCFCQYLSASNLQWTIYRFGVAVFFLHHFEKSLYMSWFNSQQTRWNIPGSHDLLPKFHARHSWSFIQTLRSQRWRGRHGPQSGEWKGKNIVSTLQYILQVGTISSRPIQREVFGSRWRFTVLSMNMLQSCMWMFSKNMEHKIDRIMLDRKKQVHRAVGNIQLTSIHFEKQTCMCSLGWCCAMPDAMLHLTWKLLTMKS